MRNGDTGWLHPPAPPLGEQKKFSEAFSALTVIKEVWFPHLLTDKEREQIAKRDAHKRS
jgi:hypothetical protein